MINVMVVDDQALVRTGFSLILNSQTDMHVLAEASNGVEAIEAAKIHQPDVILMDIRMPEMDGLDATARILSAAQCKSKIIILTTFDPDEYVFRALRSGASGFVLKDIPPEELIAAVRTVAEGGALLAPTVTQRLIQQFAQHQVTQPQGEPHPDPALLQRLAQLTGREKEVLSALADGKSNLEIAQALHIGASTVKSHVSSVLAKLELRDRAQAVVFAYECGLAS